MATGSSRPDVRFWDAATGRELQQLSDHRAAIIGVGFSRTTSRSSRRVRDGAIRVWKPAAVKVFAGHEGPILAVAAHPNGAQVYTASADRTVKVFDLNRQPVRTLAGHTDAVTAVALSPDGTSVSGGQGQDGPVLERGDGNPVLTSRLPAAVLGLAVSADSKLAGAGLADGSAKVLDLAATEAAKAERQIVPREPGRRPGGRCFADRATVAAGREAATRPVRVWAVSSPRDEPRRLAGHANQVYGVAWSPDGKQVVDRERPTRPPAMGRRQDGPGPAVKAHANVVYAVAYQPQGRPARDRGRRQARQVLEPGRRQGAAQE